MCVCMCVVMVVCVCVCVCVCSNGCVCVVGWNGGKVYDRSEDRKASMLGGGILCKTSLLRRLPP